jgi:hypothetical protein
MRTICAVILSFCIIPATFSSGAAENLTATQIGSRIDVTIGGKFFTSYRFAADEKYPFFFPVNGPSGTSVTSMRNAEFPHHSSLFFGCDMVNGGNYWQEALNRGQIMSHGAAIESASGKQIVIRDTCDWKRPGAPQPLRDTRRIVITAPSPQMRQIDFSITLEALEEVTIKKTNHSLMSARMDPDLTPMYGGTIINAEGATGEKETFGKTSPWLACFGSRNDKTIEGLAILQHPQNHGYPTPWFTRDYGFLSPTPMFWPADNKETRIQKGKKLHLSYRILIFSGTTKTARIEENFKEFSSIATQKN